MMHRILNDFTMCFRRSVQAHSMLLFQSCLLGIECFGERTDPRAG